MHLPTDCRWSEGRGQTWGLKRVTGSSQLSQCCPGFSTGISCARSFLTCRQTGTTGHPRAGCQQVWDLSEVKAQALSLTTLTFKGLLSPSPWWWPITTTLWGIRPGWGELAGIVLYKVSATALSLEDVLFPSDLDKRLCIEQECPGREWFQTNLRWGMWQPQLRRWDRAGASATVVFTMSLSSSVQECGHSPAPARPGFSREPPSCPSSFSPESPAPSCQRRHSGVTSDQAKGPTEECGTG